MKWIRFKIRHCFLCVGVGSRDADLEVLFFEIHASLCAPVSVVHSPETMQGSVEIQRPLELWENYPELSLLQRSHKLGHGAGLSVWASLLDGGSPDPLVWGGECGCFIILLSKMFCCCCSERFLFHQELEDGDIYITLKYILTKALKSNRARSHFERNRRIFFYLKEMKNNCLKE